MSLTNFFKRFSSFFGKNKAKKIAEKAVNEAQYTKDIEHAKQILMRALEENPELLESVLSEFGKKINESENTPNKLLDKVAVEITESDVIPNSVLKAEGVIENMTDEGKKQLIDNNAIALKAQHAVMSQI